MKPIFVRAVLRIHRHIDGLGRVGALAISGTVLPGQDAEVDAVELDAADVENISAELAARLFPARRVFIRASGDTAAALAWALRYLADDDDTADDRAAAEDEALAAWSAEVDASHVAATRGEAGR